MIIEQLSQEIRDRLRLHRCRHKACDCCRACELLSTLEALARVRFPWHPDLIVPEESELSQKQMKDPK